MKRQLSAVAAAIAAAGSLVWGAGVAAAEPPPTVPSPGDRAYCGAHTSPWDCWSDVSPERPGEKAFIDYRLQYDMAGIPTERTRLLQIARGICQSLVGGTHPNYVVKWLAEDIGATEAQTGQMFIMAQDRAC